MKNWTRFVLALSLTVLVSLASGQKVSGNQTFGSPTTKAHPTSQQPRQLLSSLPLAAQAMISATLGRDDARYRVGTAQGALCAESPNHALGTYFTLNGIQVRTGRGTPWRMTLRGYGYGDRLEQVREATPVSQGNRVEYRRGPLVEWYVNGPAGLEQGFTLATPPGNDAALARRAEVGSANASPLTIALGLGGGLTATAESPGKGQRGARVEGLTLRDANGHAVLRYTGLNAHDADGRELVAWLELTRQELRLRVEDAGARYPLVVDPFVLVATLTASDAAPQAQLGVSVSTSGDGRTIAVGAPTANGNDGAVYVYVKPAGGWSSSTETAKLTPSDYAPFDEENYFGDSVAVSSDGRTIAVGAFLADERGPNGQTYEGAAYVFVKPAGGWKSGTETAKLTPSNPDSSQSLGSSIGVSGDGSTIAVGEMNNISDFPSAVYVYVKPAGGWTSGTEIAQLTGSDEFFGESFGPSVALSNDGDTIAVGSGYDGVYVFVRPFFFGWASTTQNAKLTATDATFGDGFGQSVGISSDGSVIAAGAPYAAKSTDPNGTSEGAAYIFVEHHSTWTNATQTAELTQSGAIDTLFGWSIGISGDGGTVVVGTDVDDGGVESNNVGAAYVFVSIGRIGRRFCEKGVCWTQTERLNLGSRVEGQQSFGNSVAISSDGSTIVVGAPATYSNGPGSAYVFGPGELINPFPPFPLLP